LTQNKSIYLIIYLEILKLFMYYKKTYEMCGVMNLRLNQMTELSLPVVSEEMLYLHNKKSTIT